MPDQRAGGPRSDVDVRAQNSPLHIVGVSSGVASAFTWAWALDRYGPANVVGLFADVNGEDADNYRFLEEVKFALRMPRLVKLGNDGRTIFDVFAKRRFLGNTRVAPCSLVLKFEACRDWMKALDADITHYLGIDWTEEHRFTGWTDSKGRYHRGQRERWEAEGIACRAPMVEETLDKDHALKWLADLGIEPPTLTRDGYPHANCMGFCIKAGTKQAKRLLVERPQAFAWWESEEERIRAIVGDFAILRDRRGGNTKGLPLRQLRRELQAAGCTPTLFDDDDREVCGCASFDDEGDTFGPYTFGGASEPDSVHVGPETSA